MPSQGIDTSEQNPCSKFQLDILAAVCEFERSIIVERVNAGIASARAKGVKLGRPPTLDQYRTEVVRLRQEGKSIRGIAKELKLPTSSVMKLVHGRSAQSALAAG